jgi:aminopeptidase N
MYQTLMGREIFRRGMEIYIRDNDNSAATVEDFFHAMQAAAPELDLAQIMRWYDQAGTPEITFAEAYDPASRSFTLTLRQYTRPTPGQPEKLLFLIPVALGLLDAQGRDLATATLALREAEQSFVFANIDRPAAVSLFRGFSAPVKLKGQSPARLAFLAAKDSDLFNRWDALQQYAIAVLLDAVAAHQAGQAFRLDNGLQTAFAAILAEAARDPAFTAEALPLPAESLLADEMEVVDPDAIHAVREAARAALGRALHAALDRAYADYSQANPADISGPAMAARALKNAALAYLTATEGPDRAWAQFHQAGNMTDYLAALVQLADHPGEQREAALTAFYQKWRTTPLVLDKWFAVQARSSAPDTLERVQALMRHPEFDLRNPNRVRALIGAFTANQAKFHDASGAGYQLLAETVLRLDPLNPQIAARLAAAFSTWRRFDSARQNLLRTQLERILATEDLSANTFEVVSKALETA